jgi:ATP-binding cassette subfamily B protein
VVNTSAVSRSDLPPPNLEPPILSIGSRLRAQAGGLALGCLCLAATNALALTIPWLLKETIEGLGAGMGPDGASAAPDLETLVARNALLIAIFAVLQAVIRTWSRVLIFNAGRNVEYTLRGDLFTHLTRMDPAFFRAHPTGDVMSRLTNDLGSVRMLFGPGVLNLANTALVYGSSLWLLLSLSPRLTVIALVPYPLLIVGARLFSRSMYRASREIQDQLGKLSTAVQEDLAGIAVVKHYALEPQRHALFSHLNDEYLDKSLKLVRVRGTLMPLFAVIGGIGTLIVLWAGGREVIQGRMTVGALVAFNAYLVYLSWPTIALGWILSVWQRGIAAWVRVRALFETPPQLAGGASVSPAGLEPSIEVRGLSIKHDEREILHQVSFTLPAGGTLAIVGPTGGGKTTLVDAIPRLQDVPPGSVFIGGEDVTRLPLRTLRGMVGYAPQEPFLFSATVAENIAFGLRSTATGDGRDKSLSDGDPERVPIPPRDGLGAAKPLLPHAILRAAEAAGLARDVAVLPEGYDTLVGERGITLSGGQRQRIALARALAADPRILILDDSLSSVDAQTEKEILSRLRPILKGRTSILVSHRIAAVKDADQILVLDGGRVAERGTHPELLAAAGLYAALYREQLAVEALAEVAE